MSAFILSKDTIDALVTAYWYLERELDGVAEPIETALDALTPIGRMLWQANHDSVNARYRETHACEPYAFAPMPGFVITSLMLQRVLGLLKCYEYQSCEHATWETCEARAWYQSMVDRIEPRVPWEPSRFTTPAWQKRPVSVGSDVNNGDREVFQRVTDLDLATWHDHNRGPL